MNKPITSVVPLYDSSWFDELFVPLRDGPSVVPPHTAFLHGLAVFCQTVFLTTAEHVWRLVLFLGLSCFARVSVYTARSWGSGVELRALVVLFRPKIDEEGRRNFGFCKSKQHQANDSEHAPRYGDR